MTVVCLPDAEAALLRETYSRGDVEVILEYGSGGSTKIAASLPQKLVISVESDREWAANMQAEIDRENLPSPAILHHVDIGPTGEWGRPLDFTHWQKFHRYPLSVWSAPYFKHPDVVLIDGRFRPACLAATAIKIERPVVVLFDDYADRPTYERIEAFARPTRMVGRMAVFDLKPNMLKLADIDLIMDLFSEATRHGQKRKYQQPSESKSTRR